MSDQQTNQAPAEDTPDPTAHSPEQAAPAVDYEKRYSDLRPQFDRATQELAQYRQLIDGLRSDDEDTRLQAAQNLGFEFVTDDQPAPADTDPLSALRAEMDGIKQTLTEREQQAQQAQQLAELEQYVTAQMGALTDLHETDRDWVLHRALNSPVTPDGMPDIHGAYQALVERDQAAQKRWAETKRTQRAPVAGQAGTQAPDLTDPGQRQAWMAERLSSLEQ